MNLVYTIGVAITFIRSEKDIALENVQFLKLSTLLEVF